tara:strand:- start:82 stop:408 length:327 start_codon:yes stop_codon:yes gene_type:complete
MFQLRFLNKENDLNKIIKRNKRDRYNMSILFVSLWDEYSSYLVDRLKAKYADAGRGEPLYIVDSFQMPHSFVIYNSTKVPQLVQLRKDGYTSEDYLPMVMKSLRVYKD